MSLAPTSVELRMMPDPMLPHPAVIEDIQSEAYGISTFSLVFTDPPGLDLSLPTRSIRHDLLARFRRSAIWIISDPSVSQALGHAISYAGSVTRALGRLKVGNMVGVRGPYGSAWPLEKARGQDL